MYNVYYYMLLELLESIKFSEKKKEKKENKRGIKKMGFPKWFCGLSVQN